MLIMYTSWPIDIIESIADGSIHIEIWERIAFHGRQFMVRNSLNNN